MDVHFVPTGHLIYTKRSDSGTSTLQATSFDARRFKTTGQPQTVLVEADSPAFSRGGTLAYIPLGRYKTQPALVWADRSGSCRPLVREADILWHPRISPDGKKIAVERFGDAQVWIYDLERGVFSPVSPGAGEGRGPRGSGQPVWSPDGTVLAVAADGEKAAFVPALVSLKTGAMRDLIKDLDTASMPESWSPDGTTLVLATMVEPYMEYPSDLAIANADGSVAPRPLLSSSFIERGGGVSPDGKWIAHFCNESGRFEAYVQTFPELGSKVQVSSNGGMHPLWSSDGKEMFYLEGDKVMAVPIRLSPTFVAGTPKELFTFPVVPSEREGVWDVAPDGQHFVLIEEDRANLAIQINVVLTWFDEITNKVPVR